MVFKYYHGTSSIFIESIRKNGLGGINPNFEYRNLDLLRFLYVESEKYLMLDSKYLEMRSEVMAMVNQTSLVYNTELGLYKGNYNHEHIYVSLTPER